MGSADQIGITVEQPPVAGPQGGGVRKEFNTEAAIPQICDAVSQPHHPTGLEAVLPGAGRK